MSLLVSSSCINMYKEDIFSKQCFYFVGQEVKIQLKFTEMEFICVRVNTLNNLESGLTTALTGRNCCILPACHFDISCALNACQYEAFCVLLCKLLIMRPSVFVTCHHETFCALQASHHETFCALHACQYENFCALLCFASFSS